MKKHLTIPLLTVIGGAGCFLFRLLQNRTGFEADTGLPIPGTPLSILLPSAMVLLAAALFLLGRQLPNEKEDSPLEFREHFLPSSATAVLTVCGLLLWLLSGVSGLLSVSENASSVPGLYLPADRATLTLHRLPHVLSIFSACCLLPAGAAAVGHRKTQPEGKNALPSRSIGNLILLPVICLALRLALAYREMSVNASQQTYYVELFALMFLILGLYRLSSFAFHCGKTRRFILFAALAVILGLTALADAAALADRLFFSGGAALMLGFLLARLSACTTPSADS